MSAHAKHPAIDAPRFPAARLDAAIIDLDGTMVDTADDFTASINALLARLDAPLAERDEIIGYVGKGSEHLIRSVLAARFDEDETTTRFPEAIAIYQDEYARINGRHTRLYPEVEAGLAALAALGLKLACVTNKPHRFAVALLAQYGLDRFFSAVLGGDSLPRKKPDPAPMLAACATLGVAPQHAVAIGDSDPLKRLFVAPLREARKDWPVVEIESAGHLTCVLKPQFAQEIVKWIDKQPRD